MDFHGERQTISEDEYKNLAPGQKAGLTIAFSNSLLGNIILSRISSRVKPGSFFLFLLPSKFQIWYYPFPNRSLNPFRFLFSSTIWSVFALSGYSSPKSRFRSIRIERKLNFEWVFFSLYPEWWKMVIFIWVNGGFVWVNQQKKLSAFSHIPDTGKFLVQGAEKVGWAQLLQYDELERQN